MKNLQSSLLHTYRGLAILHRISVAAALSASVILGIALDWSVGARPAHASSLGLVAGYAFSEASGTTTADASGNNNTGTLNGATRTTTGEFGSALVFNGTSAFVNLGNPATLQLAGSMTVSAWIKATALPFDDAAIVSSWDPTKPKGFQLDTTVDTGPRRIGFKLTSSNGVFMIRYGASVLQLNQWVHVAGVYDAAAQTMDVYLNGALDDGTLVGTVTGTQQTSALNTYIGRRADDPASFNFNGTIDEVRVYNRALAQAEIQTDMNTPLGGVGTPPPPDTTPPSAPAGLGATAASATQINLAWTASTDNIGVTGYRVERCQGSACTTFAQIATPTTTSLSDTGLSANTGYSYRVLATDAGGNLGAYSNVASGITLTTPDTTRPTAPTGPTATVVSSNQVNLIWNASTDNVGVTGYRVDRCQGSGCTAFAQIAAPITTSFSNTGLAAATTYRYRVRAADAAGNVSTNSSSVTATTQAIPDTTPPSAPTGLSAGATSSIQIGLAWVPSTDNVGVTSYRVERCQGAGCSTFAQVATPAATNFNDTGLTAGTSYSYRVRAADAAGNLGAYSIIASATTQTPNTTAPSNLTAAAVSGVQINLGWTAPTSNVGVSYRLERCQGASCVAFAQVAAPTGTSFNDTGLPVGSSQSYQVRAVDAVGNLSAYSNVASATTLSASLGLIGGYAFSEASGTTTADASGNNNTGTLNGATRTAAGQFGNALVFNGTSAFVDLGNPATLQLTGSMTISAWIKAAAFPVDDAAIVSRFTNTAQGFQIDATVDTGPRVIGFKLTDATGALMIRYGATTLQLNQWYFVTGIYDAAAKTLDVYLNGQLNNGTLRGTVTATQQVSILNVNIGRRPGTSGFAFNGTIDEVRIYNRALTQVEVQADMSTALGAGTTPPPPPVPTVSLAANPTSVASGGSSTLTWSSTNATSCLASGAWSGSAMISGSQSSGALTSSSTFTLACTGSGGTTTVSATVTVTPSGGLSYTTNFIGTENPLSEGGLWTLGGTTGRNWNNPQKSGGRAFGSQTPHAPPPFDDSVAHLSGFPANQSVQGTIYSNNPVGGLEVELLLRFEITANNARGYEVDLYRGGGAVHIVRWNGPLNNYSDLSGAVTQNVTFNDGDVWYAEMVGNVITVKCNNIVVWQSDRTGDATLWSNGNPGIGFYVDTNLGAPSANDTFGWKSFTALAH